MKDRLESKGIVVRHCPTLQMIGNFFTKPLQGNLFHRFRNVILGYSHVGTLALDQHPPIEECVVGEDEPKGTGRSDYGTVDPSGDHNSASTKLVIEKERDALQADDITWQMLFAEQNRRQAKYDCEETYERTYE